MEKLMKFKDDIEIYKSNLITRNGKSNYELIAHSRDSERAINQATEEEKNQFIEAMEE